MLPSAPPSRQIAITSMACEAVTPAAKATCPRSSKKSAIRCGATAASASLSRSASSFLRRVVRTLSDRRRTLRWRARGRGFAVAGPITTRATSWPAGWLGGAGRPRQTGAERLPSIIRDGHNLWCCEQIRERARNRADRRMRLACAGCRFRRNRDRFPARRHHRRRDLRDYALTGAVFRIGQGLHRIWCFRPGMTGGDEYTPVKTHTFRGEQGGLHQFGSLALSARF